LPGEAVLIGGWVATAPAVCPFPAAVSDHRSAQRD